MGKPQNVGTTSGMPKGSEPAQVTNTDFLTGLAQKSVKLCIDPQSVCHKNNDALELRERGMAAPGFPELAASVYNLHARKGKPTRKDGEAGTQESRTPLITHGNRCPLFSELVWKTTGFHGLYIQT